MKKTPAQKIFEKVKKVALSSKKVEGYGSKNANRYHNPIMPFDEVIIFKKGPYFILDSFTGGEQNFGRSTYYLKGKPVYGMLYYGTMTSNKVTPKETYSFLKKALRAGVGKAVHRGPKSFKEGDFLYVHKTTSKRGFFEGEERIYYGKKLAYIQVYFAGPIYDSKPRDLWAKKLLSSKDLVRELNKFLKIKG